MTFCPVQFLNWDLIIEMIEKMEQSMDLEGILKATQVLMVLELIMIAAQGREPCPTALSILQQTAMIRTFSKTQEECKYTRKSSYGAGHNLRKLLFPVSSML